MKTSLISPVFAAFLLLATGSMADAAGCSGNQSGGASVATLQVIPNAVPAIPQVVPTAPAPAARITLVPPAPPVPLPPTATTAKLSIIPDAPAVTVAPVTLSIASVEAPKSVTLKPVTKPAAEEPELSEELTALVGGWKAVARQGDGELTTIELQLDSKGWAELTVPGSDGQPKKTKSRVKLDNLELKLKDASEKVVSLGKLVDFNSRQMVLQRKEGLVTFVRL